MNLFQPARSCTCISCYSPRANLKYRCGLSGAVVPRHVWSNVRDAGLKWGGSSWGTGWGPGRQTCTGRWSAPSASSAALALTTWWEPQPAGGKKKRRGKDKWIKVTLHCLLWGNSIWVFPLGWWMIVVSKSNQFVPLWSRKKFQNQSFTDI